MSEQMPLLLRWNLESFVPSLMQSDSDGLPLRHMHDPDVTANVTADKSFGCLGDVKFLVQAYPAFSCKLFKFCNSIELGLKFHACFQGVHRTIAAAHQIPYMTWGNQWPIDAADVKA